MTRHRLLLAALLASIALAAGGAPAHADGEIALSLDGETWGDVVSAPLFERNRAWVPGDVETRSFYVRNDGPSDARLTVGVRTRDDDHLVANHDVSLSVRAAGRPWTPLDNGQDVSALVRESLEQGRALRVDVRAAFRWASPNESMSAGLPLEVVVTLRQDGPVEGAGPGPGGLLPDTGSVVPWWLTAAAAGLVGAGLVLVGAGRRRRSSDG